MRNNLCIVSGYFNPVHSGHIDMFKQASSIGRLVVIVNNDKQQIEKKGKIIIDEQERCKIVNYMELVSEVKIAIDKDNTVCETIKRIHTENKDIGITKKDNVFFCNGGDRPEGTVPEEETCKLLGIHMLYGIGGDEKTQSSSNINKLRGKE